jgi:hypothetical protein
MVSYKTASFGKGISTSEIMSIAGLPGASIEHSNGEYKIDIGRDLTPGEKGLIEGKIGRPLIKE